MLLPSVAPASVLDWHALAQRYPLRPRLLVLSMLLVSATAAWADLPAQPLTGSAVPTNSTSGATPANLPGTIVADPAAAGAAVTASAQTDAVLPEDPLGIAPQAQAITQAIDEPTAVDASPAQPDPANALPLYGYLNRDQLKQLPPQRQRRVAAACRGVWIAPVAPLAPGQQLPPAPEQTTTALSDYAYYDPKTGSELAGNVQLKQPGRLILADKINVDAGQTTAIARGNVTVAEAGVVTQGETAEVKLDGQGGALQGGKFFSETQQAGGTVAKLTQLDRNRTRLETVEYSTCDPEDQVWKLRANRIDLNQENGRGIARNSVFMVKNVPLFYLPYVNFPLDDRRMSGFLYPEIGISNRSGFDLALPYYFNLAPNYDLTLTSRLLTRRGLMLDGEFRWLTRDFGSGQIQGAYLPQDRSLAGQPARYVASGWYNWQINPQWRTNVTYNTASDDQYYADFSDNPLTGTIDHLERRASLYYGNGIPGLNAELRALNYQTINPNLPDAARPFDRLPQLLINYRRDLPQQWRLNYQNDTGWFRRNVEDGSGPNYDGLRFYNGLSVGRSWRNAWGYVTPNLSVRQVS